MPQRITDKPPNPRNFKNRNKLTFHIKTHGKGRTRFFTWSLHSRNGAAIANSPEDGYDRIGKCLTSIGIVMENTMDAGIEHPKTKLSLKTNNIIYSKEYLESEAEEGDYD